MAGIGIRGAAPGAVGNGNGIRIGVAQGAHVMEGGRIQYAGTAKELREKPELLHSAYLLRGHADHGKNVPAGASADSA